MPEPKPPSAFVIALRRRTGVLLWLCALASLSAPLSRWLKIERLWALELFAHWQWLYLGGGALCLAALLALRGGWRLLLPSALLALVFLQQPASLAGADGDNGQPVLVVASANLNLATSDFAALQRWLLSEQAPDLLFLQEFTEPARRALASAELHAVYPYRIEAPQADPFGLAILSRHPLEEQTILQPSDPLQTLRLHATLQLPGGRVGLAALHPMPPLNHAYVLARDTALAEESRRLALSGEPAVMAGDFNATPWNQTFLRVDPQLRRASALTPTWPNAFGWLSLLPLDHVFASAHWQRIEAAAGPHLGSDHRPVVVHLQRR